MAVRGEEDHSSARECVVQGTPIDGDWSHQTDGAAIRQPLQHHIDRDPAVLRCNELTLDLNDVLPRAELARWGRLYLGLARGQKLRETLSKQRLRRVLSQLGEEGVRVDQMSVQIQDEHRSCRAVDGVWWQREQGVRSSGIRYWPQHQRTVPVLVEARSQPDRDFRVGFHELFVGVTHVGRLSVPLDVVLKARHEGRGNKVSQLQLCAFVGLPRGAVHRQHHAAGTELIDKFGIADAIVAQRRELRFEFRYAFAKCRRAIEVGGKVIDVRSQRSSPISYSVESHYSSGVACQPPFAHR